MFLSNPRPFFLLTISCVIFLQACGSSQGNENKPVSLTVETKSGFPFSTKEPEVYQGDFFQSDGTGESHCFIVRKGNKWRYDRFRDGPWRTEIMNETLYTLDHERRIYKEDSITPGAPFVTTSEGDHIGSITNSFFGKEYREFDDLGVEAGLRKYSVRQKDTGKGDVFIFIDETSGMIVRQDFTIGDGVGSPKRNFTFEIRNLKLEVDDSIFQLPGGYRKVSRSEFSPIPKRNDKNIPPPLPPVPTKQNR